MNEHIERLTKQNELHRASVDASKIQRYELLSDELILEDIIKSNEFIINMLKGR